MIAAAIMMPVVLPLAAWPLARLLTSRLSPLWASCLLSGSCLILAIAGTGELAVRAFAGITVLPQVARLGGYSPAALRGATDVSEPVSVACGIALLIVLTVVLWSLVRYGRRWRALNAELDEYGREGGVILLPDEEPVAFAVPGRGGRIVVSNGVLALLRPGERGALLAHEAAHLRLRHHVFLGVIAVSRSLNPLIRPLAAAARFSLERWADEAAARRVGDRHIVGTALAKAALAGGGGSAFVPAASGGDVPRRVAALLGEPSPPRRLRMPLAVVSAAAVVCATAGAAGIALDAATDLHAGIETAQVFRCNTSHEPAPSQARQHCAEP